MADSKLLLFRPASGSAKLVLGDSPDGAPPTQITGLVFSRPSTGSARLTFGKWTEGGAQPTPAADVFIDADFAGDAAAEVFLPYGLALDIDALFAADGGADLQLLWDANVSRGGLRHELRSHWQPATAQAAALGATWQQARPLHLGVQTRWQQPYSLRGELQSHWQEAERLRSAAAARWQQGELRRFAVDLLWQEAERLRAAAAARWQQADLRRTAVRGHWQEMLRLRAGMRGHWQHGELRHAHVFTSYGDGLPVRLPLRPHWQEAWRPRSGVSILPKPPAPPPCYDPARLGLLVFDTPYTGDGRLVFICHRAGPGPEQPQFVIPLLRVYMTVHTIEAVLLPGMDRLPLKGITVSSDDDGFGWNLTASGPADPLLDMLSPVNGAPKQVKVSIDGIDFVFAVEQPERSRRFLEHAVQVRGSSVTALLGAPHVAESAWSTSVTMTAQQIILQALQFTGVDLDWRIDDWLVPTAAWSHQGTPLSVAQRVAEAAGAVLRSHRTLPTLQVAPRFPRVPWEWGVATPNVVMPGQIITTDSLQSTAGVEFNAVYVSGSVQGAIVGHVVRTGTIGDVLAPEVSDRLVTDVVSARQRGISVLSAAALKRRQTMTVPLLTGGTNPGLILPGYLIQVQEPGETWRGLVRGITVTTGVPTVRQQLVVERAG